MIYYYWKDKAKIDCNLFNTKIHIDRRKNISIAVSWVINCF